MFLAIVCGVHDIASLPNRVYLGPCDIKCRGIVTLAFSPFLCLSDGRVARRSIRMRTEPANKHEKHHKNKQCSQQSDAIFNFPASQPNLQHNQDHYCHNCEVQTSRKSFRKFPAVHITSGHYPNAPLSAASPCYLQQFLPLLSVAPPTSAAPMALSYTSTRTDFSIATSAVSIEGSTIKLDARLSHLQPG